MGKKEPIKKSSGRKLERKKRLWDTSM